MSITIPYVMFCVITANAVEAQIRIHDTHVWLSKCHVALTEYGFENPKEECFCTKVTPNANETQ